VPNLSGGTDRKSEPFWRTDRNLFGAPTAKANLFGGTDRESEPFWLHRPCSTDA